MKCPQKTAISFLTFLSVANSTLLSVDMRVVNARRHLVSRDKSLQRRAVRVALRPPSSLSAVADSRRSYSLTRRRLSRLYELWRRRAGEVKGELPGEETV